MPIDPEILKTLLERLREQTGLLNAPTSEDLMSRLRIAAAGVPTAKEEAPRMIMYYGGVNKFAEQPVKVNLASLGVKTKSRGDVLDRMREGWRRGR
jgi:hypothetical protein